MAAPVSNPRHPPDLHLELLSQARFLSGVRALIGNLAQRLGFNEMDCGQISLAVDEALCNIINHGYGKRPDGRIWLSVWLMEDQSPPTMTIVIEDLAKQVDPHTIQSRNLDDIRPGGLGVHIIREVMHEVRYEKRDDGECGMRLTMIKRLPQESCDECLPRPSAPAPRSTREVARRTPDKETA